MTIENLKQIAIKYASTKGSRIPLAPDELCNAVVQYMNSFFGVMTDINTIKVAVTEDSGNIVFTITGNTYDGKPITPIVITVDHNDFVTDQEFEEFKTTTNAAIQKNTERINSLSFRVEDTENDINTIQVQVGQINTRVGNTETNIVKINSTLNNKLDKITSPISSAVLYANIKGNDRQISYTSSPVPNTILYRDDTGKTSVVKGVLDQNVANMENIADVEAKIPDVSNFPTLSDVNTFTNQNIFKTNVIVSGTLRVDTNSFLMGLKLLDSKIISGSSTVTVRDLAGTMALLSDIPAYTTVNSVSYDITNGAIIAYDGAHEIHIPLLAGDNVTIDASEDNKKIVISAAGGGGAGDVTAAGNNTFTGENTFTNEITFNTMKSEAGGIQFGNFEGIMENGYNYSSLNDYQFVMQKFVGTDDYYETLINADLITYKPAGNNNVYEFHFPNKSGTFAMTTDVIKNSIYFISFYANEPSEPCHLIGTMMSKNSYGTGQKTNDEFAVMLADNFYTNSNEGLAAYGRLAEKDILCIYSEDGLSIRCLNEENSEADLPTIMFFVMETEL